MTDFRCIHDLTAACCADCRPAPARLLMVLPPAVPSRRRAPRRPPREPGRYRLPEGVHAAGPQRAKSPGVCAGCGQLYAIDALIKPDITTGGWTAECCFPRRNPPEE